MPPLELGHPKISNRQETRPRESLIEGEYAYLSRAQRHRSFSNIRDWSLWFLGYDKNMNPNPVSPVLDPAQLNQALAFLEDGLMCSHRYVDTIPNDFCAEDVEELRQLNTILVPVYDHIAALPQETQNWVLEKCSNDFVRALSTYDNPEDLRWWGDALVVFETLIGNDGGVKAGCGDKDPETGEGLGAWRIESNFSNLSEMPGMLQRFAVECVAQKSVEETDRGDRGKRIAAVVAFLKSNNIEFRKLDGVDQYCVGPIGTKNSIYPPLYSRINQERSINRNRTSPGRINQTQGDPDARRNKRQLREMRMTEDARERQIEELTYKLVDQVTGGKRDLNDRQVAHLRWVAEDFEPRKHKIEEYKIFA